MKKLILIGAADSIGVPYSRDNRKHEGFFELISRDLSAQYDLLSINAFHMAGNNDGQYISRLIHDKITVAELKRSQNAMLAHCKYSGIYPYLEIPRSFLGHYHIKFGDETVCIQDEIRRHDTIFIYSALINDILKMKELSLFKLLAPGRIERELADIDLAPVLQKLNTNINELTHMNPNIQIYIVGLFIPTKLKYIRRSTAKFIGEISKRLIDLSHQYNNVFIIDNSNLNRDDFDNIDFHPNRKGHLKIYHNFCQVFHYKHPYPSNAVLRQRRGKASQRSPGPPEGMIPVARKWKS